MKSLITPLSNISKQLTPVAFLLSIVLLIGTWVCLYWAESLFTESHLVGYYCCVTEHDLPTLGTPERTLSDFFRTSPGQHLPSLIFIAVNVGLLIARMGKARDRQRLPLVFAAFNILYLVLAFGLVNVSWLISNLANGPQTSAYKGYDRTGYGIVLHLVLWVGFFVTLAKGKVSVLSSIRTVLNGQ